METKKDYSYGIIPVRKKEGRWEVFLIHQYSHIGNNSYWTLPKGHAEEGEAPEETAVRELKEETGLKVQTFFSEPQFSLQYMFVHEGMSVDKQVVFFIAVVNDDAPILQLEEVKEAGWYTLSAAFDRLEYKDMKRLFAEAVAHLEEMS